MTRQQFASYVSVIAICLGSFLGCARKMSPSSSGESTEAQSVTEQPSQPLSSPIESESSSSSNSTLRKPRPIENDARISVSREGNPKKSASDQEGENTTESPEDQKTLPNEPNTPRPKRSGKKVETADATLKSANTLRDKARQAASRKDFGQAFLLSTQAWEAAKKHPNDARLRRIADEVADDLENFGKQANDKFDKQSRNSATRLTDK